MRDANVRGLVAKLSRRNERVTLRVEDIAGRYRWYLFGHDVLFGGVYGGARRARDISVRHVVRHARGREGNEGRFERRRVCEKEKEKERRRRRALRRRGCENVTGELRRRRSGFRGVDGSESAVDETERERSVRSSDESVRISRLHELSIDEKILREREQRERKVAFSRRRRKKSTSERVVGSVRVGRFIRKMAERCVKVRRSYWKRHERGVRGALRGEREKVYRHTSRSRRRGRVHRHDWVRCHSSENDGFNHRIFAFTLSSYGEENVWKRHVWRLRKRAGTRGEIHRRRRTNEHGIDNELV